MVPWCCEYSLGNRRGLLYGKPSLTAENVALETDTEYQIGETVSAICESFLVPSLEHACVTTLCY